MNLGFVWLALLPWFQDREALERDLKVLEKKAAGNVDAEIFAKGAAWALRYEAALAPKDAALVRKSLDRGLRRSDDAAASWGLKKGKVVRGFRSAIDASVQPYALIVPSTYDPSRPLRLDVVLHGSQQPNGLSELRFIERFDDGDDAAARGPGQDYLELHPLARVENGYRWAGETDVFEAIEAVCRNYAVDRRRIVLRGMSAGASGTWHIGLTQPDRFVALGPYCGYVDTHQFSETPIQSFVRVGALPAYQEKTLSMLDAVGYAANARMVPAIACIGEKDVFFQAHVIMGLAMKAEGLDMINLISPGTGHVIDPVIHKEQLRRIGEHVAKGLDPAPREVHFVTWTLKYSRCFWLQALALKEHYVRSELHARVADDGSLQIDEPRNIRCFAVHPPFSQAPRLRIGKTELPLEKAEPLILEEREGRWTQVLRPPAEGKRPGLQGPIDDAFAAPFLCVRGTGKPWNAAVQTWADASLKRFEEEWRLWFRGDLPLKDDSQITADDLKQRHLILFGDPGSNRWIREALPKLPLTWTADEVRLRGKSHPAVAHAPALICASPLPGAEGRYLVLNSGHTFHPSDLKLNYLFFPRLGDWAVMKVGGLSEEAAIDAGLFDEDWK